MVVLWLGGRCRTGDITPSGSRGRWCRGVSVGVHCRRERTSLGKDASRPPGSRQLRGRGCVPVLRWRGVDQRSRYAPAERWVPGADFTPWPCPPSSERSSFGAKLRASLDTRTPGRVSELSREVRRRARQFFDDESRPVTGCHQDEWRDSRQDDEPGLTHRVATGLSIARGRSPVNGLNGSTPGSLLCYNAPIARAPGDPSPLRRPARRRLGRPREGFRESNGEKLRLKPLALAFQRAKRVTPSAGGVARPRGLPDLIGRSVRPFRCTPDVQMHSDSRALVAQSR